MVTESGRRAAGRPRRAWSAFVVLTAALGASLLGSTGPAAADTPATTATTVTGQLLRAWPEFHDRDEASERAADGPLSFIRTASGNSVRVQTADVERLPVGATVRATVGGTVSDDASRDDGYEKARDVLASQVVAQPPVAAGSTAATTTVNHQVSVVMVVPRGGTRDATRLSDVVGQVNGPVADFWSGQTDGAVQFGVTAQHDWIDASVGCEDPYELWDQAAQAVGFTPGPDKHLLVYLSDSPADLDGCSDGLGEVGWNVDSGGDAYVRYAMTSVIAHELGHNLGLGHSSLRQCDNRTNAGFQSVACQTTSYLDLYDVMGFSWDQLGSLDLAQAARLVRIQSQTFEVDSAPATVTLTPVSQRAGVRGIAMRDSDGRIYWLEYRPPSGQDAWLGTTDNAFGLDSGVLVHQQTEGDDTALLLDGTPSPGSGWDDDLEDALPVGSPVRVDDSVLGQGTFEVTVLSTSPSAATVQVVPKSAITLAYEASGGSGGPLGASSAAESCGTYTGRYCQRSYAHGAAYWSQSTGAHLIWGDIFPTFAPGGAFGGSGTWGFPTTDTTCGGTAGGCRQHFEHGGIYWSSTTGAIGVRSGALWTAYLGIGEEAGVIGYPTADQACDSSGGCRQSFQGGVLAARSGTAALLVPGTMAAAWAAQGYEAGPLGYPVSGRICGLRSGGCGQVFQGGRVYEGPGTGAHAVTGAVQDAWIARGWENGALGYPTGDQVCGLPGASCKQQFQGGTLYSSSSGVREVSGTVGTAYVAAGGDGGALGVPTSNLICGLKSGGCGQVFQGGRIYSTSASGTHAVTGAVQDAWIARGWETGPLGYPTGDQVCGLPGASCKQQFQGGTVYSSSSGAREVSGTIGTVYAAAGGDGGALGVPTSSLICGLRSGGCGQVFQGGRIYSSSATGTHAVTGGVQDAWVAQGWETGPLGYPTGDQVCGLASSGCGQVFQGGRIYSTAGTGAHAVSGGIQDAWIAQGWENGPLGYPTSDVGCGLVGGGCGQAFEGGAVYSSAGGTRAVSGAVATAYAAVGSQAGALGYPTSALICGLKSGGCGQVFQGGRIYSTAGTGAHAVSGGIQDAWIAQGWENGPLGYPTSDVVCGLAGGGCEQDFQGGPIYTSPATGAHAVSGAVATAYTAAGAHTGTLGLPASDLICGLRNGGCGQVFQGGRIYSTSGTGAHAVTGAIQAAWIAQGWEQGSLGYPTSDAHAVTGGTAQDFQGGTLTLDSGTGQVTRG